jgi:hypothetical protein
VAPTDNSGTYTQPFEQAFSQVSTWPTAIQKFNEIVDHYNSHRAWYGPAMAWWIKDNLQHVKEALRKAADKVEYANQHYMPVIGLMLTGDKWVDEVETPVSNMSSITAAPKHDNEDLVKWTGDAATAYNAKEAAQKGAIDDTAIKANFISKWLFTVAQTNVDYAATLAKMVTDIVGKLIQAAADATSAIDLPWAIDELAKVVGKIVEDGLNALILNVQAFTKSLGDRRDINASAGDHTKLPDGHWPVAVSNVRPPSATVTV